MKAFIALWIGLASTPLWAQSSLQVAFRWQIAHHCSATSPSLKLANIPPGTTRLKVQMIDLDNHNHDHGGDELSQPEGFPAQFEIPSGALKKYSGPCPENFTTLGHEYQFNVTALNQDNASLATGSSKATFSAKFVILQGVIGNQ